ncbi:dihydroxyacetone kinase subunit DhaL [Massiliimalia massiliensis]|uniref:dihydroxyacetone kinase subunit DhaL n=1 Tax=Massiliimalia massiliensis TaxID=1852384 RepID=UPI000985495C|nr:dihydroxyacetone kinase subunit DhaL [Massiliimalia massiliensis]
MKTIKQSDGKVILMAMVKAIQENKAYLGEVDGLIGDGDHGMNMNKGFSVFEERFGGEDFTLSDGLNSLAMILMNEIGGSMGPIYGTIFMEMADSAEEKDELTVADVRDMLQSGMDGLFDIVDARVGDKTLVDTLSPAVEALSAAAESGSEMDDAMQALKKAATSGRDSTKDLVAKYGRSSRLGERSKGVLDAGATSCCLLLCAIADAVISL